MITLTFGPVSLILCSLLVAAQVGTARRGIGVMTHINLLPPMSLYSDLNLVFVGLEDRCAARPILPFSVLTAWGVAPREWGGQ